MFSPRIALVGALSGAATVALSTMLVLPASGQVVADPPTKCFDAQTQLTSDQHLLAQARQLDALEDSTVSGAVDFTPDAQDKAVTNAIASVSTDQGYVNALCGTAIPTPTPTPGPVGLPRNLNCAQLAARGIHDIPASSVWYRTALDANGDGIGCETNLNTYRVVNGQKCHLIDGQWVPVTTVTAPAPCTACSSTVTAPPPVIYQSPPVTVPAPVIQGAPVYVPGPVVSVPNTSAGINTGDGSTADDPITITVDLGDILSATPLPTLPTLPKV